MSDSEINEPVLPKLNARRAAFVAEYLIDLNGTQAAIRAGYSPHTANEQAAQLLANLSVIEAVERGKAQRASRVNTTADSVIHEISLLANSCVEHYEIDDRGNLCAAEGAPDGAMRAVQSVKKKIRHDKDGSITYEVEFRLWDKPGQLKLMGRHAGAKACFDRVEHTGKDGGPIELTQVSQEELLARHKALAEASE